MAGVEKIECLVLKGVKGIAQGEEFYINLGETVTIGRSRFCKISLRRCPKYKALTKEEKKSNDVLSISRKHLRLVLSDPECIELRDISTNGTFIDGSRIKDKLISNIKDKTYEIRLGTHETFLLQWTKRKIINPQ